MARERYKEPTGLDSGIDDGVPEIGAGPMEPVQTEVDGNLPKGYAKSYFPKGEGYNEKDVERGYCAYPGLELEDMFGAFKDRQYGVVGGDKTVDDFTPAGLDDDFDDDAEDKKEYARAEHRNSSQRYP